MTIQLHCFGESGNSYKAALTLELADLDWQPVLVDFFNGASRTQNYRDDINEMGEVPVLVAGDLHLSQSGAIQQWVIHETGRFGGRAEDQWEVMRWQYWDNHKLSSQAGMIRFLLNYLPVEKREELAQAIGFLQGRLRSAFEVLETRLTDRTFIVGNDLTVADLSCCGYLFYDEPFGFERSDWPKIDAWLGRVAATPGWKHPYDLMPPARPENQSSAR
ncbi:MAG: glutathione S-transferase [Pseudomonadota bacterium]